MLVTLVHPIKEKGRCYPDYGCEHDSSYGDMHSSADGQSVSIVDAGRVIAPEDRWKWQKA